MVVVVVESLDLSELERAYAGRGSEAYHPATLLSLLIYGYATGVHSSRKIERATYDSLAFRFIACDQHPDHDTLATFRRRFGEQFSKAFVQVLQVARENQLSRFGTVSLDGTKIRANASRHRALSYGHALKIEVQLKAEVQELLDLAESADQGALPDNLDLPAEIARREDRLAAIGQSQKSKHGPRSGLNVSRPSTSKSLPIVRPNNRPAARSLVASRPSLPRRVLRTGINKVCDLMNDDRLQQIARLFH